MTLQPMTCVCCGGIIDRATMTCTMCGVPYRFDDEHRLRIIQSDLHFDVLQGQIMLPSFYVEHDPQQAMEIGLHHMAEQMAEKLLPFIEYRQSFDPCHQEYSLHGRIRVANPNSNPITLFGE